MAQPGKYPESLSFDEKLKAQVAEAEVGLRIHHRKITDLFRQLYADVAFKMTPVQFDLSFFRSQVSIFVTYKLFIIKIMILKLCFDVSHTI